MSKIIQGDCLKVLKKLPDESVHCVITSPPYWGLRDYGTAQWVGGDSLCDHRQQLGGEGKLSVKQNTSTGTQTINYRAVCDKCGARRIDKQLGLEKTPEQYVERMVIIFREVKRVLRDDGTCWLNMGDTYVKKQLMGIPWKLVFALQSDGWYLRQDMIWQKPNPMPESVTDRCCKSHEYLFLLSKSAKYYCDMFAICEPTASSTKQHLKQDVSKQVGSKRVPGKVNGSMKAVGDPLLRNKRSVWTVATQGYADAHFATFPEKLIEPCILAGSSEKGVCESCGAPFVRVLKRGPLKGTQRYANSRKSVNEDRRDIRDQAWSREQGYESNMYYERKTVRWKSTCNCTTSKITSGVILDPFFGAGTTGIVAKKLKRDYLGIELNPEYIKMARKRLRAVK